MNMLDMANPSAMGISPEAHLLVAQVAAAGGGFGQRRCGPRHVRWRYRLGCGPGGPEGRGWMAAHAPVAQVHAKL